MKKFNYFGPDQ